MWLLCNVVLTIVLVPAIFPGEPGGPDAARTLAVRAGSTDRPMRATSAGGKDEVVIWDAVAAESITSSTTTTVPPTTLPPTTVAPRPAPVAATRSTTTTTKPKPAPTTTTTTVAPAREGDRTETGKASWYDDRPGICAHKTLPFGTVVTVTNVDNGRTVNCTVDDRGPFVEGRIIDLNPQEFSKLAPLSAGVIDVRISW